MEFKEFGGLQDSHKKSLECTCKAAYGLGPSGLEKHLVECDFLDGTQQENKERRCYLRAGMRAVLMGCINDSQKPGMRAMEQKRSFQSFKIKQIPPSLVSPTSRK